MWGGSAGQQTMYKYSTLCKKQPHFHNHSHGQQHQLHSLGSPGTSGGGSGIGLTHLPDFVAQQSAGGSVVGISTGTMKNGQFSYGLTDACGPMIISMPQLEQQQQQQLQASHTNNVPILNSILTSTSGGGGGHNSYSNSGGNAVGGGGFGAGTSSTSTLKKRVQIQEVTV